MKFDYSYYVRNSLIIPGLTALLFLTLFIINLVSAIKEYHTPKSNLKFNIIACLISFILIIIFITNFSRGFMLLFEKENDAISSEGVIEKIERMSNPTRYGIDGNRFSAVYITVNGRKHYAMTSGDFEIGDNVEIIYLPKSGFILEINYKKEG